MHTDSDSVSVEEALEAREDAASSPASVPASPSSSSSSESSSPTVGTDAPTADVRGSAEAMPGVRGTSAGESHSSPSSESLLTTPQSASSAAAAIHNSLPQNSGLTPADRPMHVSQRLHESASSVTSDCHFRRHAEPVRVRGKSHRRRIRSEGGETSSRAFVSRSPDLSMLAPIWVPDELVASCTACDQSFTMLRRRHHCRNCGQIYCSNCSSHTIRLGQFGYTKPVRVCDSCFVAITSLHAFHSSRDAADIDAAVFQSRSPPPTPGLN